MMTSKVALFGANNPEVVKMLWKWKVSHPLVSTIVFLDNNKEIQKGEFFCGYKVVGGIEAVPELHVQNYRFVNLVTGDTVKRFHLTLDLHSNFCRFTNFIHPDVDLYMVDYGTDVYIQDHVIIQVGVNIGNHVAIHTGAIIAHECEIGHYSFIAHGACLSGKVEVGTGAFIGANVTVLPRIKIGDWAVVGAGAVVTKDVAPYTTVVGNPAREIRK